MICYDNLASIQSNTDYLYESFINAFPNYLVNYVPINIGGQAIRGMIEKPYNRIDSLALLKEEEGVFNYLRRNQNRFNENAKQNLFDLAIGFVFNQDDQYPWDPMIGDNSQLKKEINSIIHLAVHVNTELLNQKIEENTIIGKLDISAQLRFYDMYGKRVLSNVTDTQKEEILRVIKDETITEQSYPEYILHYLTSINVSLTDYWVEILITLENPQFFGFLSRYAISRYDSMVVELERIIQDEQLQEDVKSRYKHLPNEYRRLFKIK